MFVVSIKGERSGSYGTGSCCLYFEFRSANRRFIMLNSYQVVRSSQRRACLIFRDQYHVSSILQDDAETPAESSSPPSLDPALLRSAAIDYNNRRAAYKRNVSELRKSYAQQIAEETAKAQAAAESARQTLTRQRLERQRKKNERSAANALRLEQFRKDREQEFHRHLEQQQQIRTAKYERFQAARQLVVDELEQEAPLWMTSVEEVNKAFSHENTQLLWAFPGGVLGAPQPTADATFWEYQSHTWHMTKTYKSQKQLLLEKIEEEAYDEANIDPAVWTLERRAAWENKQRKAKLRALIHAAGRTALIQRQQQLLNDLHEQQMNESDVPKPKPVASMKVLRNNRAIEEEGAKVALENPHQFFQFDQSMASGKGKPVDLRDPIRDEYPDIFPKIIGREPAPDTRTEKEKKVAQKEMDKKWAEMEAQAVDEEEEENANAIDYDTFEYNADDEDFKSGSYNESEIDWVTEQLSSKLKYFEQEYALDLDAAKQDLKSEITDEKSLEAALIRLPADELVKLSDLDEKYSQMDAAEVEAAIAEIKHLDKDQILQIMSRDRSVDESV